MECDAMNRKVMWFFDDFAPWAVATDFSNRLAEVRLYTLSYPVQVYFRVSGSVSVCNGYLRKVRLQYLCIIWTWHSVFIMIWVILPIRFAHFQDMPFFAAENVRNGMHLGSYSGFTSIEFSTKGYIFQNFRSRMLLFPHFGFKRGNLVWKKNFFYIALLKHW